MISNGTSDGKITKVKRRKKIDFTKLRGMQFAGCYWDYKGGAERGILRFTYETRNRWYADQQNSDRRMDISFTPSEQSLLRSVDRWSERCGEAPPMAQHNLSADYEDILTTIQITISVEDFLEKIDHSCCRFWN